MPLMSWHPVNSHWQRQIQWTQLSCTCTRLAQGLEPMNIPKTQRAAALWSTVAAVAALLCHIQELCGQGFYPRCGKAGVYTLLCPRKSKPTPLPQGRGCSGWKCSPPCPLKLFHPTRANHSSTTAVQNMSEHEPSRGYGPRGRRQRRFRCPFLPLRSFWVLYPRSNV